MRVCNCVAIEDKMVNAARGLSLRLLPIGAGALQIAFYAFGSAVIDRSGWQGFKHKIDKDFISTYLAELVIWPAFQVWGLNSLLTHCDQQQWHCQVDAFCAALCPVFLLLPLIDKPSMSPEAICVSISTLCQLEMHSVQKVRIALAKWPRPSCLHVFQVISLHIQQAPACVAFCVQTFNF
eukprot:scaffold260522_cov19-Tisochrysis_lutea.AAC.1